jgi:hypothetical protein
MRDDSQSPFNRQRSTLDRRLIMNAASTKDINNFIYRKIGFDTGLRIYLSVVLAVPRILHTRSLVRDEHDLIIFCIDASIS